MKISIALSILILGSGAILGWQDHRRLDTVCLSYVKLVMEAAQSSIARDPFHVVGGVRVTKRELKHEKKKEADAKNAAAEFITFVQEMNAIEKKRRSFWGGQAAKDHENDGPYDGAGFRAVENSHQRGPRQPKA